MLESFVNPLLIPVAPMAIRFGLALLFFAAALHKTRYFNQYCRDIRAYELLPTTWVGPAAIGLSGLEWLLVICLPVLALTFPLVLAAALLTVYALAIGINLLRGRRHIDCGCYGPAKARKELQASTITPYLVVRNLLLAGVALLCLAPTIMPVDTARTLVWLDFVVLPLCLASLVILYQAVELFFSQRETVRQFHQRSTVGMVQ